MKHYVHRLFKIIGLRNFEERQQWYGGRTELVVSTARMRVRG